PVCVWQGGEIGAFEESPIVYDGLMYITLQYSTAALDPRTCRRVWFNARTPETSTPVAYNRGVALYRGKVFRSTPDGHLIALDAKTGQLLWDVRMSDTDLGYWLSAAPVAYKGKVFMGEGGADWGVSSHIFAFDAETGRHLWTFNPVPTGDMPGAETWKHGSEHGGGSFWSSFTIDPAAGLVDASIGNPAPDYDGSVRPGDNLYTDSVVALDAETGKLAWYEQQTPHDLHDYDTAAAPVIYQRGGKEFMAVANKGGWLFLYDRKTHAQVAKSEVSRHENSDVPVTRDGVHVCPGITGGTEWSGPAYSPEEGLLFVNSVDWCGTYRLTMSHFIEGSSYFGGSFTWDDDSKAGGWIRAFDASTGQQRWAYHSKTPMLASLTPTAGGIVFTGDLDGDFLALDQASGKVLYRFNTGGAVAGAASTYLIDGRQYVAVTSGNASQSVWHTTGAATVFVFALPEVAR
ncbi:MAG TPA: PQQ-binding-like beta-propeller repeat protein, partial [Stellaceae bacterium]|nr:PQQ-binding-like beta-propeller repeat protein [Stellaceae bacterium]